MKHITVWNVTCPEDYIILTFICKINNTYWLRLFINHQAEPSPWLAKLPIETPEQQSHQIVSRQLAWGCRSFIPIFVPLPVMFSVKEAVDIGLWHIHCIYIYIYIINIKIRYFMGDWMRSLTLPPLCGVCVCWLFVMDSSILDWFGPVFKLMQREGHWQSLVPWIYSSGLASE